MADDATAGTVGPVEKQSDFGTDTKGQASYWKAEIKACDKELDKWRTRGQRVVDRYRDEKADNEIIAASGKRYNILWSNIRTLKPAIYGKSPQPVVVRRFKDPDQVARVAALILERTLAYQIATQRGFSSALKASLEDRLLPGMGTVWVRYDEPEAGEAEYTEQPGAEGKDEPTVTTAVQSPNAGCQAVLDYVYWRDFGFIPARSWEEVPAVWRSVYMDRAALVKRFGADIGNAVKLDYVPARHKDTQGATDEPSNQVFKQARIYEVWDKRSAKVTWISLTYDDVLDQKDDPIKFPGFFPCPKPLFATNTTGNLVPVPDYTLYQDQATELDTITERLHHLTKALKVVGVYDSENAALARVLNEGVENQLIPVDTWAAFAEKGGMKGTLDFVPIEQIITVVTQLYQARATLIQDVYQITGLSDIVRGSTNPNETAKAQTIKAQFASVRLEDMKGEMAMFVTEALQLMGHVAITLFPSSALIEQSAIMESEDGQQALKEAQQQIMAKQQAMMQQAMQALQGGVNSPQNSQGAAPPPNGQPSVDPSNGQPPPMMGGSPGELSPMTGGGLGNPALPTPAMPAMPPVPPQSIIDQALQLLRTKTASFRIEVAADSMIEPDLNAERQARNEFLTAITQFLQQAIPAAQSTPELEPLMHALLLWGVRGFRVGRDIEGMIESAMSKMAAAPPKQPPPDPKMAAIQAKASLDQQTAQADQQRENQRMQNEMALMDRKMSLMQQETDAKVQGIIKQAEARVQAILLEAGITAQVKQQAAVQQAQSTTIQSDAQVGARAQEFQQELQHGEVAHQQAVLHAQDTHAQGLQQGDATHQQTSAHAQDTHQQGMQQSQEQADAAAAAARNKPAPGAKK